MKTNCFVAFLVVTGIAGSRLIAQSTPVLFDFDTAPIHSSLPLTLTSDGLTAQFTATGNGFSIQPADTLGFTPVGFSGLCIYPNSVFAADLLISFDQPLSDISILYAPEEYATDASATLKISAYLDSTLVGFATHNNEPGTWPSGTLSFSSTNAFNNVVIHYAAPPVGGGDYGPIFMADNLVVTPTGVPEPSTVASLVGGLGMFLVTRRFHRVKRQ